MMLPDFQIHSLSRDGYGFYVSKAFNVLGAEPLVVPLMKVVLEIRNTAENSGIRDEKAIWK